MVLVEANKTCQSDCASQSAALIKYVGTNEMRDKGVQVLNSVKGSKLYKQRPGNLRRPKVYATDLPQLMVCPAAPGEFPTDYKSSNVKA